MKKLLLATVVMAHAQSFEVASIKPSVVRAMEGAGRSRIEHTADSLTMRNVDLKACVEWAYGVEYYQIPAANSLDGKGYDILAKAAGAVPVSQLRLMLRQLLKERFKLTVHQETKTLPVYALTVGNGGPKLPAANADDGHHAVESLPRVQDGSFFFPDASMSDFATKLSMLRGMDRPVVDQTGIQGFYDIVLKGVADAVRYPEGASLFTLIPEQLGMKLVATKAPIEIVVIDHAEKPSEN